MADNEQQKGVAWGSTLRGRTQQFNDFVNNIKQRKLEEKTNAVIKQNQDLYNTGVNTKFRDVSNECNRAVRMSQVASGAIDYLSSLADFSDIDFGDDKWTDTAVINSYKAAFPETASIMKNYVKDDSNTDCDPTQFYKDMGWDMTEGEERIDQTLAQTFREQNLTPREAARNVLNTFLEPLRITSKGVRTLENAFENTAYDVAGALGLDKLVGVDADVMKSDNSEMNAIIQYALDTYTDNGLRWQLTEDEMNQATKDLMNNPELLSKYMGSQNYLNGAGETALGGAWLTAELGGFGWAPAVINGALSVGLSLPATQIPMETLLTPLTLLSEGFKYVFEETPGVNKIWNMLDEDTKNLVSYYLSGKAIGAPFKRNKKTGKIEVRPIVKNMTKNIGNYLMEAVDWAKNRKASRGGDGDGPTGGAGAMKELTPEEQAIQDKMELEAAKTINPKYIYENKQASDAYSQLDPEELRGVKDFKSLIAMIRNAIKGKSSTQDAILDTVDKKYGSDVEYREPLEGRGETSDIPSKTVEKWFNIMDNYTHFTRDKNILNILKKVADKGNLSAKDLKIMARALDRQFKIWKKGKTQEQIKEGYADIEAVRQELNSLVRNEVEGIQDFQDIGIGNIMEHLDRQQSPMIATVEKLVELNNKVNQIKAAIPDKSVLNKVGTFLGKFSSKSKAANEIINKMGGADYMDALLREKNLNRALNAFSDLLEKLNKAPDKSEEVIKNWLKDKNNKEVAESYGGFVEGEVMEPDYNPSRSPNEFLEELLEPVKVENPEDFMLGEDAKYNGQDGIDYTTPIRVTPEGYAGRYGQTIESFKAQLQKAGASPEKVDAFIDNLNKKNFKVGGLQKALIEDVPSGEKTKFEFKTLGEEAEETTASKKAKETLKKASKKKEKADTSDEGIDKTLLDKFSKEINELETMEEAFVLRGRLWSEESLSLSPKTRARLDLLLNKKYDELKKSGKNSSKEDK